MEIKIYFFARFAPVVFFTFPAVPFAPVPFAPAPAFVFWAADLVLGSSGSLWALAAERRVEIRRGLLSRAAGSILRFTGGFFGIGFGGSEAGDEPGGGVVATVEPPAWPWVHRRLGS